MWPVPIESANEISCVSAVWLILVDIAIIFLFVKLVLTQSLWTVKVKL